jgi:hypothetical protein
MWKILKVFPRPEMMLKTWQIDDKNGLVLSKQQNLRRIGVDTFKDGRIFITYVDKNNKKHLLKRSHIIYYHHHKSMPEWGLVIDHEDKNPNNDKISNLRAITYIENADNCKKQQGTSSKYKGVNWDKKSFKWMSKMRHNNITYHCGRYLDETDAAKEYDKIYWQVKKSTLGMNFPELLETYKRETGVR